MSKRATGEGAEAGTRRYGEGSISQRGEKFRAQAAVGGRRVSETFPTRQAAKAWLRKVLADADKGMLPADGGKVTVGAFLDRWLANIAPSVKPRTAENYGYIIDRHLGPALGTMRLDKLRPDHLQGLYATKLEGGLSRRTVQLCHAVIHHALDDALKWGLAARNVADAVTAPRPARKEMRVWTVEQARAFLAGVAAERMAAAYHVALFCGPRLGELVGLRWEDVDLATGCLHVRRTLQRLKTKGGGIIVGEPKTARARRRIDLPAPVVAALKKWKLRQLEERLLAGQRWRDTGYVFTTSVGTPIEPRNFERDFAGQLARINNPIEEPDDKLPTIRVHDLRHTAATTLLTQNVHPKVVQELLGHSTIAMTLDIYSHVLPTMQAEAARTMERALSG